MADSPPYFGRYTVTRNRNKATSKIRQLCQEVEVEMEAGTWQATSESESGSFKLYTVVQLQPEIIMGTWFADQLSSSSSNFPFPTVRREYLQVDANFRVLVSIPHRSACRPHEPHVNQPRN